jgi:hypothetical protein
MDGLRYTAVPLKELSLAERQISYTIIDRLCSPGGDEKRPLGIKSMLLPEPEPIQENKVLGRLYNGDTLVGGIFYELAAEKEINRIFVCTEPGYGRPINEEFERAVLATDPGPIRVLLRSIVDPNRKVAKFHMMNGYIPLPGRGDPLVVLQNEIPMVKILPAAPLSKVQKEQVEHLHTEAAKTRKMEADRKATLRSSGSSGGRRRRRRRSTKKKNRYS